MKKLSATLALFACVIGLAGCKGGESFSDEILRSEEYDAYTVAGAFESKVEGTTVDWKYTEQGAMEATSLKKVAEVDKAVAKKLASKKLLGLYIYEGARIHISETGHAGWTKDAMRNGEKVTLDGGFALKAIGCNEDDLTHEWLSAQWIPDPHTACVENLTPKTYFVPTWQEAADEHGFAWNSDPVIIGGAGIYTVVVAEYDATVDESKTDSYNYAMAVIKTEEKPDYVPLEHDHWRLVGSINGWNQDDTAEALQFNAENELTYTFAVDDEFKVVSALTDGKGDWGNALGFSDAGIDTSIEGAFVNGAGNIRCATAGTYDLIVDNGHLEIYPHAA